MLLCGVQSATGAYIGEARDDDGHRAQQPDPAEHDTRPAQPRSEERRAGWDAGWDAGKREVYPRMPPPPPPPPPPPHRTLRYAVAKKGPAVAHNRPPVRGGGLPRGGAGGRHLRIIRSRRGCISSSSSTATVASATKVSGPSYQSMKRLGSPGLGLPSATSATKATKSWPAPRVTDRVARGAVSESSFTLVPAARAAAVVSNARGARRSR